jgi:hypothetical protein
MKTIKNVFFGAVLFCSASAATAIPPLDVSPASATDSTSIYRKDFLWESVQKARASQENAKAATNLRAPEAKQAVIPPTKPIREVLAVIPPVKPSREVLRVIPPTHPDAKGFAVDTDSGMSSLVAR